MAEVQPVESVAVVLADIELRVVAVQLVESVVVVLAEVLLLVVLDSCFADCSCHYVCNYHVGLLDDLLVQLVSGSVALLVVVDLPSFGCVDRKNPAVYYNVPSCPVPPGAVARFLPLC